MDVEQQKIYYLLLKENPLFWPQFEHNSIYIYMGEWNEAILCV